MKIYIVRNEAGLYRAGSCLVNDLEDARFHKKIGPAKSQVTSFSKFNPSVKCPEILEFTIDINQAKVLNMETETIKKIKKIEGRKLIRELEYKERQRKYLEEDKARIEGKLKNL